MLICSKRKVLVAGSWFVLREKCTRWWLISQTNKAFAHLPEYSCGIQGACKAEPPRKVESNQVSILKCKERKYLIG
jgi:hypothetical protein